MARIDLYLGPRDRVPREDLPAMDASGEWVAGLKYDGEWCLLEVEGGRVASMSSRMGLPLTGVAGLTGAHVAPGSGLLAGEWMREISQLRLFEPIVWNGIDLRDLPLEDRREALSMIHETRTDSGWVHLEERRETGFLAWYDEIVAGGSRLKGTRPEGLVLKRRGSVGRATCIDGKVDHWVRVKPLNTVDYVVIGPGGVAKKGTPKVALGLWRDGKLVEAMRPTWPVAKPGQPRRPDGLLDMPPGTVVEVEGAEVHESGAVRHGHVKRPRKDKRPEDCTYEAAISAA